MGGCVPSVSSYRILQVGQGRRQQQHAEGRHGGLLEWPACVLTFEDIGISSCKVASVTVLKLCDTGACVVCLFRYAWSFAMTSRWCAGSIDKGVQHCQTFLVLD